MPPITSLRALLSPVAVFCLGGALFLGAAGVQPASADPWMWDQDTDGLDDRLAAVAVNGLDWAFENMDPNGRLRFEVSLVNQVLQYGGYVRYLSPPTQIDADNLTLLGAEVITVFDSVPYIRVRATYPTLTLIAGQPEVDRVEAVSLMYSMNYPSTRATGVRGGAGAPFPTLAHENGPTGNGVVVAVLDTGINDQPSAGYPGHIDVLGKVAGGAFYGSDGPGYSTWTESTNPSQTSAGLNGFHATHLAGTIAGGTTARFLGGLAPDVDLIDVKVLGDEGMGSGLAEGLEWCIKNKDTVWGSAAGIDVINLSLSGTDPSNGDDAVSALVNAAVAEGLVVIASSGNNGDCGLISTPGAADGAITVGAYDSGATGDPADDALSGFTGEGPRVSDGDADQTDEMKPDVTAPGVGVLSAWGSTVSDGAAYIYANGTSMAAAAVSGVAALLLESDPSLTPAALKSLLRDTATHNHTGIKSCAASDPFGVDARYHTGWGYGAVDAYAAWQELTRGDRTQFVRLSGAWDDTAGEVVLRWTTQREADLTGFVVERAADVGGAPGAFSPVGSSLPAMGYTDLTTGNRTSYQTVDIPTAGTVVWYRVTTTGGTLSDVSLPVRVRAADPAATVTFSFTHNTPETDLTLVLGTGLTRAAPDWQTALDPGDYLSAVTIDPGPSGSSDVHYLLTIPVETGSFLPPSETQPWWVSADEGGDTGRTGTLDGFTLDNGTLYVTDSSTPKPTLEGGSSALWIPEVASTGVGDGGPVPPALVGAFPNPFRGATTLRAAGLAGQAIEVTVHDVQGRRVTHLFRGVPAGDWTLSWRGADDAGRPLAPGRYFVRVRSASGTEVIPVVRLR